MIKPVDLTVADSAAASARLKGIGLSVLGYACFSVQDATVKWLVARYPVPEILLMRSLVIIVIALGIGRRRTLSRLLNSRNKWALVLRAGLVLAAWLSYFTAAPRLGLAELTTLYFAAPVIAVVLSVVMLRERVDLPRWGAVAAGFAGVVLAANPARTVALGPAGLALFAAGCWGLSVILVRLISRTETTANQMLVSNGLFAIACAAMLLWRWTTPDPFGFALMIGLGVVGGLGQFLLYEGFRFAPASLLAPIEYTGLVWAFLYGYLIWGEIPGLNVFAGAGLIVAGSLFLFWWVGGGGMRGA